MAINDNTYTVTDADLNGGLVGLSQKLFGGLSQASTIASLNGLTGNEPLVPGQTIRLPNLQPNRFAPFAQSYAATLPGNKVIFEGLPDPLNPNAIIANPDVQKVNRAATNFFFDPLERQAYSNVVIPGRIQEGRQLGQILERAGAAGTVNSSLTERLAGLLSQTTDQQLDQTTDQINAQIETQRINEEQQRLQDLLQQSGILGTQLYQNSFELTPEQILASQLLTAAPDTSVDRLAQLLSNPESPLSVSLQDLLSGAQTQGRLSGTTLQSPETPSPSAFALRFGGKDNKLLVSNTGQAIGHITQSFGHTDFAKKGAYKGAGHTGIDVVYNDGQVRVPMGGTVIKNVKDSGTGRGYGNYVQILGDDGNTYILGHLADQSRFGVGSKIRSGDIIGKMGSTGFSTGAHTHIEVRDSNGSVIDPTNLFMGRGTATNTSSSVAGKIPMESVPELRRILTSASNNPVAQEIYNFFASKYGPSVGKQFVVTSYFESAWKPNASLTNSVEASYGPLQINILAHRDKIAKYTGTRDIATNAKWLSNVRNSLIIADEIYKQSGFRPWSGAYKARPRLDGKGTTGNKIADIPSLY